MLDEINSIFFSNDEEDTFFILSQENIEDMIASKLCFTTNTPYGISVRILPRQIKEICYLLDKTDKTYLLIRKEKEYKPFALFYDISLKEVLIENILSFHIWCYDGEKWFDEWNAKKQNIPKGVKIKLISNKHKFQIYVSLK
jgi:hypothetical protein